ncbi:hypothetical protein ACNFJ7_06140 [Sphingomonas sp. HT-1]|jgi:uncharacterized protein (UPF0254 family)|uniref:hypothetical protein n=1 Tax=unclassified Sphingomonas TaxID=196159 RepID=UPI0003093DD3|nr:MULTISPECIES: hypothetical protein [unclassified Sphingomonas]KTF69608.1 hypothetical protein ATB93_08515 [Sphingomonas sp. WG]
MSNKPSVLEEAQASTAQAEPPHEGEAIAVAKELAEAKKRRLPNNRQIGMGAAIGVGSAAIVAGLLYWRGGRKDRK